MATVAERRASGRRTRDRCGMSAVQDQARTILPGTPAPTPTPRPTEFSPDLALSPNPYQPGSPVDPRPTAAPTPDPSKARRCRPSFRPIWLRHPTPSSRGARWTHDPANPFVGGADAWSGAVGQTPNPFAVDPQQTAAAAGNPVQSSGQGADRKSDGRRAATRYRRSRSSALSAAVNHGDRQTAVR